MAQGNYDHPSYLTRQQINLGKTTAGSAGTTVLFAPAVSNMRIRQVSAAVIAKGTSTASGGPQVSLVAFSTNTGALGTATLATMTLGTAAALTNPVLSGDLNYTLNTNFQLGAVNGTDATLTVLLTAEAYLDPSTTWTGNN